MQKIQAQNIVRETLQNDFDKERFLYFIKNLFNKVDESKAFHARGYVSEAYKDYVKTYERLGTYTDPEGSKIDILIVYLQKETSLERARTAQRNFIARYLKDRDQKDAGLVAFVSPDPADWRFSLVKMEYKFTQGKSGKTKVQEEFTPAKRWSFLVGNNENSHTAQSRLAPIIEEDQINPTLKQLEDAFNIEKVTKEFFDKYRELFLRVYETLDDVIKQHPDIKADFAEKNVNTVDFSKKLLGQIVFLYFLQKKGWFGVPMNKSWGEGDKKFLRTLFENATSKNKNYFNDFLEPLFYEALAKERDDDFYSRFECRIPFLNGGLFDPISNYDWVNTAIDLPNDIFSNTRITKEGYIGDGVLDIFDRYNFTVKEDEPLEKEVAVDPEMLGKVFEHLLEIKDRKSKGTYYTPREIVRYMCDQSVINYLATELEDKVSKEDLEKFIKIGENVIEHETISVSKEDNPKYNGEYKRLLPDSIQKYAKEIDDRLISIKVCDPAIGSGAFPVGMMNVIVKSRLVLSSYIHDKNRTAYDFKRDCIQNSLYGVDIDPGAVEIAKLRLWLSLVVDEDDIKQIKPLPNLDYKIMQGNSLLEEFEGIKLFDEKLIAVVDTSKEKQIEVIKQQQSVLQKEYFELHSVNKLTPTKDAELNTELKKLENQLKKINKEIIVEQKSKITIGKFEDLNTYSEAKKKADDLKRLHKEFFEATQKSKKSSIKKQIEQLEWELIEVTLKEQDKISALRNLEEFKRSNIKPFFLWKLHFADVFEENGGFDVVIGNPPYVDYRKIDQLTKNVIAKYRIAKHSKMINLYLYFFEKGFELLSVGGMLTFISPQQYLILDNCKGLRDVFRENTVISFSDFARVKVFDASTYTFISIIKKIPSLIPGIYLEFNQIADLTKSIRKLKITNPIPEPVNISSYPQLINKIESDVKSILGEYIGIEIFCATSSSSIELSKVSNFGLPFITATDIKRWKINKPKQYVKVKTYSLNSAKKQTGSIIYTSRMTNVIRAVYIKNNAMLGGKVNVIKTNSLDPLFIISLLNSKLINFWYREKFSMQHMQGGALPINTTELEKIPIREDLEYKKSIIILVEKILKITKDDDYLQNAEKQAKVQDIEYQIDELVYKLYGLTDDEIKIVKQNNEC